MSQEWINQNSYQIKPLLSLNKGGNDPLSGDGFTMRKNNIHGHVKDKKDPFTKNKTPRDS